jgi:hypothetical protein
MEPTINTPVSKMLGDLSVKLDDQHKEVMDELKVQDGRITTLEVQYKTIRVWGLVALFAGGSGGSFLFNALA